MNNELIKKAYEHFKGVRPSESDFKDVDINVSEGERAIVVTKEWDADYPQERVGHISLGTTACNRVYYYGISKTEFEAYGASLNKPWMPEVGVECEVSWYGGWQQTFIVGKDSDGDIVYETSEFSGRSHFEAADSLTKFRPIKTEREQLIELIDSCNMSSGVLADAILNAGYRKEDGE